MISAARSVQQPTGRGYALTRTRSRPSARVTVLALLSACALSCASRIVEAGSATAEGEAVLAALEHVAAMKWGERSTTLIEGRAAVAYDSEEPLSESTRGFLDEAFKARGWRWSTEDPLVPTGNCSFPDGDCRLKDPTELHLTFSAKPWPGEEDYRGEDPNLLQWDRFVVEPVAGQEGYKVHVRWLGSFTWRGGHQAELGGDGLLVTRGNDGLVVESVMQWIT